MDTLAVNVESIMLTGQQEHADICRGTEVNKVQNAVCTQSRYDAECLLDARWYTQSEHVQEQAVLWSLTGLGRLAGNIGKFTKKSS